jgi:hypothetical protein
VGAVERWGPSTAKEEAEVAIEGVEKWDEKESGWSWACRPYTIKEYL